MLKALRKSKALLSGLLTSVAVISVTVGTSPSVQAEEGKVTSILYTCNLSFRATGESKYLILGSTDINGRGAISCYDLLTGATQHIPVKVRIHGGGIGLGKTSTTVSGVATGIGITSGPESLLGRYGQFRINGAVGIGAAAGIGGRISKGAVTVDLNIQAQSGVGVGADLLAVDIDADGPTRIEAAAVPQPSYPASYAPSHTPPTPQNASRTIYLSEGQPLQIVDAQGRVLQTIMLKSASR